MAPSRPINKIESVDVPTFERDRNVGNPFVIVDIEGLRGETNWVEPTNWLNRHAWVICSGVDSAQVKKACSEAASQTVLHGIDENSKCISTKMKLLIPA